jgi:hypothetical protein
MSLCFVNDYEKTAILNFCRLAVSDCINIESILISFTCKLLNEKTMKHGIQTHKNGSMQS